MSTTSTHRTRSRSTSTTSPRRPLRSTFRLAGALAAAGLALTLAACGGSGSDAGDELADVAGDSIVETLEEYDESLGDDAPTVEEAQEAYEEWLEGKTSGSDSSGDGTGSESGSDSDSGSASGSAASGASPSVGDCLEHLPLGAEDTDAEAPITDCAGEHAAEIYSVVELGDLGPEYPAPTVLFDAANERCGDAYLERFGAPVTDTGIMFNHVGPTHDTWDDGDTDMYCYAYPVGMEIFSGELKAENQ